MNSFVKCGLMGLAALFVATVQGNVYYVVPEGTGDGSGWENAASFETAYAAAGEAGGGELWLKKGFHVLANTVILRSGVVVRGGFAGDETSAADADPKVNVTSISGDTDHDNKWRPNGSFTPRQFVSIYDGECGYAPINPDQSSTYWSPGDSNTTFTDYAVNDLEIGFTNETDAVVTDVAFHGVVFSGFKSSVFTLTTGDVSGLVLSKCEFIANNTVFTSSAPIYMTTSSVELKDCRFAGNRRCLIQKGGTTSFTDCVFEDNCMGGAGSNYYNAIFVMKGTAATKSTLTGCTFRRTYASNSQSYPSACCIYDDGGKIYATNTVFTANKAFSGENAGNCRGVVYIWAKDATFSAFGCRFTDNVLISNSQTSGGVFGSSSGDFLFENCYLARNVTTNYNTTANLSASVFLNEGQSSQYGHGNFVNCTIEQNRIVSMKAAPVGTFVSKCDYGRQFAFINCTIADNEVILDPGATATVAAEFVNQQTTTSTIRSFFNTVCRGRGAAGHPFASLNPDKMLSEVFIDSAIYDYPAQVLSTVNPQFSHGMPTNELGFVSIPTADAKLASHLDAGALGVPQRGVLPDSPFRKTGYNYWKGTDGNWWYYDARQGTTASARTVDGATIKYGSLMGTYVPDYKTANAYHDAVGAVRKRDRVCIGPLNPMPGMILLVK